MQNRNIEPGQIWEVIASRPARFVIVVSVGAHRIVIKTCNKDGSAKMRPNGKPYARTRASTWRFGTGRTGDYALQSAHA